MLISVRCSPPSSWRATGEAVTYRELEARSNRLAHLLRNRGLKRLDHYAIFMENNSRYLEACGAGERSGLYYTCVNSYLTAKRTRLHRRQQRIPRPHHVGRKTRRRARGAQGMPQSRTLHRRRWRGRKRAHRRPAAGHRRAAQDPDRGRMHRHRHALFVGHHRPAEGHPAAAARAAAGTAIAAVRFPAEALALPRRHDLSVAGAAVSFGAAGRRQPHDPDGRHRHHHGELRSRALPRTGRRNGASPTASWCRRCSRAC